jgi:hypothetical protein
MKEKKKINEIVEKRLKIENLKHHYMTHIHR